VIIICCDELRDLVVDGYHLPDGFSIGTYPEQKQVQITFMPHEETSAELEIKFCPFCGKRIELQPPEQSQ
jgi:hypothetical protein